MNLGAGMEQPREASESALRRQLGEKNQYSKHRDMAVSPIPRCVSVSPGLTPHSPRQRHSGDRLQEKPLVLLKNRDGVPGTQEHGGRVPRHCSVSPLSSQAPDLDSVRSGGRSGRDGRRHPRAPVAFRDRGLPTRPQVLWTERSWVSSTTCLQEMHFKYSRGSSLKAKAWRVTGMKTQLQRKPNGGAVFASNKADFNAKVLGIKRNVVARSRSVHPKAETTILTVLGPKTELKNKQNKRISGDSPRCKLQCPPLSK